MLSRIVGQKCDQLRQDIRRGSTGAQPEQRIRRLFPAGPISESDGYSPLGPALWPSGQRKRRAGLQ